MRKIFRMKHESCSGACYSDSDVMRIHTLGLDARGAAAFLKRLLAMHERSCGNSNLGFRLDHDVVDSKDVFVASFQRYDALDLFAGKTPLEAMDKLIDAALAWYQTDEGRKLVKRDSPWSMRDDYCHHGTDNKLIDFAIEFSGLDEAGRKELRAQFA